MLDSPNAWPPLPRSKAVRRCLLTDFPYQLIYRVDRITGHGRKWGEGQYSYDRLRGVNPRDLENLRVSDLEDPSNYSSTAQYRLTVDYDF